MYASDLATTPDVIQKTPDRQPYWTPEAIQAKERYLLGELDSTGKLVQRNLGVETRQRVNEGVGKIGELLPERAGKSISLRELHQEAISPLLRGCNVAEDTAAKLTKQSQIPEITLANTYLLNTLHTLQQQLGALKTQTSLATDRSQIYTNGLVKWAHVGVVERHMRQDDFEKVRLAAQRLNSRLQELKDHNVLTSKVRVDGLVQDIENFLTIKARFEKRVAIVT